MDNRQPHQQPPTSPLSSTPSPRIPSSKTSPPSTVTSTMRSKTSNSPNCRSTHPACSTKPTLAAIPTVSLSFNTPGLPSCSSAKTRLSFIPSTKTPIFSSARNRFNSEAPHSHRARFQTSLIVSMVESEFLAPPQPTQPAFRFNFFRVDARATGARQKDGRCRNTAHSATYTRRRTTCLIISSTSRHIISSTYAISSTSQYTIFDGKSFPHVRYFADISE